MRLRVVLLLGVLCVSWPASPFQEAEESTDEPKKKPWFFRAAYQPGWVASTSDFFNGENVSGEPIDRVQAFKLELGWQTDGTKDWSQLYRLPALGLGLYQARFDNGDELGNPVALYGWLTWPLVDVSPMLDITADLSLGAAFNWNPFDPETNPNNDAVSTRATFFTEIGLFARFAVSPKIDLMVGGMFTHFSNGGMGDPNNAVNTLSPAIRVGYHFRKERLRFVRRELPELKPFWEMTASAGAGWKNITTEPDDESGASAENFSVFAATFGLGRRVHSLSKLVAGVDWVYDASANAGMDEVASSDKLALGLFGGYEHVIGRFSIPFGVGYYVVQGRSDGRVPELYQKLGVTYHVNDRFFVGLTTRFFDFSQADFVEWTAGFDLRRWF